MNKTYIKQTLLGITAALLVSAAPIARAQEAFTPAQKEELGKYISQYLLDNPDVVVKSLERYRMDQERLAVEAAEAQIKSNIDYLTNKNAPSIGNPDADVTIVEFFDYNCGYCKRALPDIQKAVAEDPNVRFVFKELPILSPTSRSAAEWALAAHKQGKYFEYHTALMNDRGPKDEANLERIAKELGLDVEKMKKDAKSADIAKDLDKIAEVSQEIGIQGTPAFIINGKLERGYLGPGGIERAIQDSRAEKKG